MRKREDEWKKKFDSEINERKENDSKFIKQISDLEEKKEI